MIKRYDEYNESIKNHQDIDPYGEEVWPETKKIRQPHQHQNQANVCISCGAVSNHLQKGICGHCWLHRDMRHEKVVTCKSCGKKGLSKRSVNKEYICPDCRTPNHCRMCGEESNHLQGGICGHCWLYMDHMKENINIDPYGEENWSEKSSKENYTYEEFCDLILFTPDNDEVLNKFQSEYMKYGYDDSIENFYYGNIKYWMSLL